jgi:hypothetical protein
VADVIWPVLIASVVTSRTAIFEADSGLVFRYGLPRVRASEHELLAAEQRLGRRLETDYRSLLAHANGLPVVEGNDELFGTADLGQGSKWESMIAMLKDADGPPGGWQVPLSMPVGGCEEDLSLLVQGAAASSSRVFWIYEGSIVDQWPNMREFFAAAVELNADTLRQLKEDGPLKERLTELRRLGATPLSREGINSSSRPTSRVQGRESGGS